jgi:hypothetical protein
MRKNLISFISSVVVVVLVGAAGTASAGGQSGTIGVGAESDLRGAGGLSLNFDGGIFHAGGYIGYNDDLLNVSPIGASASQFQVGGRFYYHLHSTAMSDFGVGGQLGIAVADIGDDSVTGIYIQPGIQVRMFVASNVALSGSAGFNIAAGDDDGLFLGGDLVSGFGFHYYFF